MTMSNGYFALLSLDINNEKREEYHLSIYNPFGIAKFEIAAAMTEPAGMDILRDCDKGIHKINKNKGKNKEEKLKYGKEVVEGDVSNGIEGRTKKEIQIEGVVKRSNRIGKNFFRRQSGRICSVKRMESSIS